MPSGSLLTLVRNRITSSVDSAVEDLWRALASHPGPTPRRSERTPVGKKRPHPTSSRLDTSDADLARTGDPKTVGTVRALAADGAYSKALKHLTSEGMLDPNDPSIVEQLRTLHPTGCPPPIQPPRIRSCQASVDMALGDSIDDRLRRVLTVA